jgi:hypothetical protein
VASWRLFFTHQAEVAGEPIKARKLAWLFRGRRKLYPSRIRRSAILFAASLDVGLTRETEPAGVEARRQVIEVGFGAGVPYCRFVFSAFENTW